MSDVEELRFKLRNLTKLCVSKCGHNRNVRSPLLPFVSTILETMFGTATEEKQRKIAQSIDRLRTNQLRISHAIDDSYTVIDAIGDAVQENRQLLNNLTDAEEVTQSRLNEMRVEARAMHTYAMISLRYFQINSGKTTFQGYLLKFSQYLQTLESGLNALLLNHVTPDILPPHVLRQTLMEIKYSLPSHLSLPYDPNDDLFEYYRIFHTVMEPTAYGFNVHVITPLYDSISSFSVYSIIHLPIFLEVQNEFVNSTATYVTTERFFALSQDATKIVFVDHNVIEFCLHEKLHFCYITEPIYSVALLNDNCIVSLYFDDDSIEQNCRSELQTRDMNNVIALFVNGNVWGISSAMPTLFTIICKNSSYSYTVNPPFELLTLQAGCSAISNFVELQNHLPDGETVIGLVTPKIEIPKLHYIWKSVHEVINKTENPKTTLHKLKPLILPKMSVHSLSSEIESTFLEPSHEFSWLMILLVIFLVLIVVSGVVIAFYYNRHQRFLSYFHKRKADTVNIQIQEPSAPTGVDNPIELPMNSVSLSSLLSNNPHV